MEYHTHDGVIFEIPEELESLVQEAARFGHYECSEGRAIPHPIDELVSPTRNSGVRWFKLDRLEAVLRAFKGAADLPPVEIHRHPETGRLLVRNGFHRYYAAVASGFRYIPCLERQYFDIAAI